MTLISEPERALPDCEDRGVTIRVYYSLSVAGDVLHCIVSMFTSYLTCVTIVREWAINSTVNWISWQWFWVTGLWHSEREGLIILLYWKQQRVYSTCLSLPAFWWIMIIIATIHIINIFGQLSMRNVNAKTAKTSKYFWTSFLFTFYVIFLLCGIFGILLGGKNIVAIFRSVEKGTE